MQSQHKHAMLHFHFLLCLLYQQQNIPAQIKETFIQAFSVWSYFWERTNNIKIIANNLESNKTII